MALAAFLEDLKGMSRSTVADSESVLRSFRSELAPLQEAMTNMPVAKNAAGFIELGEESVGSVSKIMREANLAEIVKISGKEVPITTSEVAKFGELIGSTPERAFKSLSEDIAKNERVYPQLNIYGGEFGNISKSAASDIAKVESNLFRKYATGSIISFTIGAGIIVATGWAIRATRQRVGCFMMTTINNKTSSCKVQSYTCDGTPDLLCPDSLPYYNVTLVLMKICSMDNSDALKNRIATAVDIPVDQLNDKIDQILDVYYNIVYTIITTTKDLPKVNICSEKNSKVENGIIPPCRMCSITADPKSTEYIDPSNIPANIAFQCVVNPSILDTITDAAISTGTNLFEGVNKGILTIVKPLGYALLAFIIIVFIISICWNLIRRANMKQATSYDNISQIRLIT